MAIDSDKPNEGQKPAAQKPKRRTTPTTSQHVPKKGPGYVVRWLILRLKTDLPEARYDFRGRLLGRSRSQKPGKTSQIQEFGQDLADSSRLLKENHPEEENFIVSIVVGDDDDAPSGSEKFSTLRETVVLSGGAYLGSRVDLEENKTDEVEFIAKFESIFADFDDRLAKANSLLDAVLAVKGS